jgi:two-component system sensor kinase FixL
MNTLWESVDQAAPRASRHWFPFVFAVLGSAAAVEATELSVALLEVQLPFLFGLGVVLICAGSGGLAPGCLATLLSVYLIDNHYDHELPRANVAAIIVFSVISSAGGEVILQLRERMQAETWRLAQREGFMRKFFHTLPAPVTIASDDGVILAANISAEQLFSAERGSLNGRALGDFITLDSDFERDAADPHRQRQDFERIVSGRATDGSALELAVARAETLAGERSIMSLYLRDETARREMAMQHTALMNEVEQLGRAVALGQLGAAIAHELNQPLTSAANYASAARSLMNSGQPAVDVDAALGDALRQIFRAGNVLRRLRQFVQAQPPELEWIDAQELIEETIGLGAIAVRSAMGSLSVEIDADVGLVFADRVQIQQVLLNLILNASEAIAHAETREIALVVTPLRDGLVSLGVSDTGCGVPVDMEAALFKPFVTSKPGGLGVGLSISKSIVEAHGGSLRFERRATGGTSFVLTLRHRASNGLRHVA